MLSAQHSQAAEHFCRDLGPAENIHTVQQGKPIGVNFIRFDFADIDVFERVALQGIDNDDLIPCVRKELKQDQMVVRSGFHDDDRFCGKLLFCTLQKAQSPVHARCVMIDFHPVKDLISRREDAHVAESFADIYASDRKYVHKNNSFSAGDHPLQEPTGAHMTQVSSGAAPYQPKH